MKKLIIIFIFLPAFFLSAQPKKNLQFVHLSTEQGLSSSDVLDIVQDKQGFIWIATGDGLNRFDSYNFKVYRKKINDSTTISHNFVSYLFVDSKDDLWIGTQRGIGIYNRNNDSFVNYLPDRDSLSNQANYIVSITEDNTHRLFVGLQDGQIFIFNRETSTFTKVKALNKDLKYIFFDSYNLMWVLADNIYIFDNNMNLVYTIKNPDVTYPYRCMIEDKDKYWICTFGSGMFWYDKKTKSLLRSFKDKSIDENNINDIYKDRENNIWIGTTNSLKLYDRKNDTFYYYNYDEKNKYSLSSTGIKSFFQDNEGNFWVLTAKGGLNVSVVKKKFVNYNIDPGNNIKLTKRIISSVLSDKQGNLWAGSYTAGLDLVDFNSEKVTHFENEASNNKSLGQGSVLMLFEDSKNNIWVGSYRGGLQQFDKTNGTFITYKNDPNYEKSLVGDDIRAMAEDKDGNLWMATCGKGLNKFDRKNNTFHHYIHNPNNIKSMLVNNWLYAILCDHEGYIWIGSSFGLGMLHKDQKTFTNYFNIPNDSSSLSNNFINCLFEDSKRNLWIGTSEGLNLFNKKNKTFKVFMQKEGLPNNDIKGILEDEQGNIWISTNMGLSKFNPKTGVFRNYDIYDGLASNEFNRGACSLGKNGQLFFGSNNGVISFFPDSIKDNSAVPPVYITGFKIFNKPILVGQKNSPLKKDIIQTKEIILKYDQSSVISFEFVSVSYIQSGKRQYAYMMEGFDNTWVYCGTKREATYTNLDPGKYIFKVKVSNNDGIWNGQETSIDITILPPWWMTVWFKISVILLVLGSFVSLYKIRLNSLKKQKSILEKMVRDRTIIIEDKNAILQSQTDELFNSNKLLLEHQQKIEEQNEVLKGQAVELNEANTLMEERQQQIEEQSEELFTMNEKLSLANATKDKFFSIIAHDLKSPLGSILGLSNMLSRKYDKMDEERRKKLINATNESTKNLYKLLDNLLLWARSQTGNIIFEPTEFMLNELIDSNIDLIENLLLEKDLELKKNLNQEIKIFADRNMIDTVVRNLFTNAIKFTENGSITVEAFLEKKEIKVCIIDTGIGIEHTEISKIFDVWASKSSLGTKGETGTGLGLILCKEFIEKHGGNIGVNSELGKGSNFWFTIPVVKY